jgi:hypothetical protein
MAKAVHAVIPAKAGIQTMSAVPPALDSGLRRNDERRHAPNDT